MYHLVAVKTVFDFAHGADAFAHGQLLLLARVKMDKAQKQHVTRVVADLHNQLLARFEHDFLMQNRAFHLTGYADRSVLQRHDVGFVFVAQRQVQHQIPSGVQMELFQLFGGGVGDFELFSGFGRHGRLGCGRAGADYSKAV